MCKVYTPERVEARYGVRPDQVPDFIGLKGDSSDNIPGVPGIGDKTAGQLIGQYGSLEAVIEHAAELSPARSRAIVENAEQARRLEGAGDDAPRPRARVRARGARARAARPLEAEGVLPPLRVPRPARAGRHARRGTAGRPGRVDRRPGALARRRARALRPDRLCRRRRPRGGRDRRGRRDRPTPGARRKASWSCTMRSRSASTLPTTRCSPPT